MAVTSTATPKLTSKMAEQLDARSDGKGRRSLGIALTRQIIVVENSDDDKLKGSSIGRILSPRKS